MRSSHNLCKTSSDVSQKFAPSHVMLKLSSTSKRTAAIVLSQLSAVVPVVVSTALLGQPTRTSVSRLAFTLLLPMLSWKTSCSAVSLLVKGTTIFSKDSKKNLGVKSSTLQLLELRFLDTIVLTVEKLPTSRPLYPLLEPLLTRLFLMSRHTAFQPSSVLMPLFLLFLTQFQILLQILLIFVKRALSRCIKAGRSLNFQIT